jgi:hypothetical protein
MQRLKFSGNGPHTVNSARHTPCPFSCFMKKSTTSLFLLGTALVASVSSARALVSSGSDSTLFATLTTSVQYNDNLFLSSPNVSNTLISAAPGLLYEFGNQSLLKGTAYYNETFERYSASSDLNTSLSRLGIKADYNDEKSKIALAASFKQEDQATRDIRPSGTTPRLVHRDLTNAAASDEYIATEKTSVSLGITYDKTNYKSASYTDIQVVSVPFKYYYKVEPKLDLSAGYRYRKNTLGTGGIDTKENFFNVGARGELSPKLTGEVSVGLNEMKPTGGKKRNGFGLDANLLYAYSPKTTLMFGANDGFSYTATGDTNRSAGLNAGFSAAISSEWQVNGGLSYTNYSYIGGSREDDFYTAQIGATYIINEHVSITGAYAYSKNKSNSAGATFTDNIVSISAAFKF